MASLKLVHRDSFAAELNTLSVWSLVCGLVEVQFCWFEYPASHNVHGCLVHLGVCQPLVVGVCFACLHACLFVRATVSTLCGRSGALGSVRVVVLGIHVPLSNGRFVQHKWFLIRPHRTNGRSSRWLSSSTLLC